MADSPAHADNHEYKLTSDADAAAAAAAADAAAEEIDDGPPALEETTEAERPAVRDTPERDEVSSQLAKLELNKVPASVYHLQLGMQETDRIIDEVDGYCESVLESAGPDAWMPVSGLAKLLLEELGYEDMDQFESALGGTFEQFIQALPHLETKIQDEEGSCNGMLMVKIIPPPPAEQGFTMVLNIRKSEDLWRTLYKAPDCTIEIPEIEFEIGRSDKRQLDALYNHITKAMFNLTQHASQNFVKPENKEKILEAVEELSHLLDIEHPWQLIIRDPSGRSILKPMDGVTKVYDGEPTAAVQA